MIDVKYLKPYMDNPRKISQEAINKLAQSITMFGFKQPIVVDEDYEIIVGHTRRLAALQLGLKQVPCLVANDLDKERVKAYRLADNKTGELSTWDFEKLEQELKNIDLDINMGDFGFNFDFDSIDKSVDKSSDSDKSVDKSSDSDKSVDSNKKEPDKKDNYYTDKIVIPNYTPTMEEQPSIQNLVNNDKTNKLIDKINKSNIEPGILKDFLVYAAYRHLKFDYHLIAEYYAHTTKEIQELFEDSALVIIDYDKAVEKGFVEINKKVMESVNGDANG
jgi:uncharacterized cupredoxin-like copper-binding protein